MEHVLSLSYGKDSLACLGAIEQLGWPLDRIVHAEVWATDTIPADLPPMVEFKAKADEIIKARWGIEVEHVCAMKNGEKLTYEKIFYRVPKRKPGGKFSEDSVNGLPYQKDAWCNDRLKTNVLDEISRGGGGIYGFPIIRGQWCNSMLKIGALRMGNKVESLLHGRTQAVGHTDGQSASTEETGAQDSNREFSGGPQSRGGKNIVQYLGIAADEPNRFHNLTETKKSPLVEIGWDEAYCRQWCEENDLLSPIYTTATRGGCWFCHNQGVGQLRLLRKNYPELWAMMLKWDKDSPVSFKPDGHTVHDFDRRFQMEDDGFVYADERWKWEYLDSELVNYRLF